MKYVSYGIVFAVFITAALMMPPRTVQYLFPASQRAKRPFEQKDASLPASSIKIKPVVPVSSITPAPAAVKETPKDVPIDLRSVVAVKCVFKNAAGTQATAYGSGVMVGAEGYVLTARHVIDMTYMYQITGGKQGLKDYFFDSCRIAVPPDGIKTPTPAEIRTFNPFTLVTEFAYMAQVAFVPPEPADNGMSDGEYDFVDSALLRITSAVNGALPHAFVVSPIKIFELALPALWPKAGDEVVSFGFPSGVPAYGSNFYLQGSVGKIQEVVGGDRLFNNQPMGMTAEMETIGGRSGSPVFWRGYVIGVVSSKTDYSRDTVIAGIYPLARFAGDAGIAVFN